MQFVPTSLFYNEPQLAYVHYVTRNARYLFVWRNSGHFLHRVPGARYAIVFQISCDLPYHSLCLAYMLLRLSEENIRNGDYHRFNLLGVTYHYSRSTVYGVAFYDANFRYAYSTALHHALTGTDGFAMFPSINNSRGPVSTWFPADDFGDRVSMEFDVNLLRGILASATLVPVSFA